MKKLKTNLVGLAFLLTFTTFGWAAFLDAEVQAAADSQFWAKDKRDRDRNDNYERKHREFHQRYDRYDDHNDRQRYYYDRDRERDRYRHNDYYRYNIDREKYPEGFDRFQREEYEGHQRYQNRRLRDRD